MSPLDATILAEANRVLYAPWYDKEPAAAS